MNEAINDNIFKSYTLDYVGKEFIKAVKDGEYILKNLKESNRFLKNCISEEN